MNTIKWNIGVLLAVIKVVGLEVDARILNVWTKHWKYGEVQMQGGSINILKLHAQRDHEQNEFRVTLPQFGLESFVFQFAVSKYKCYKTKKCNFASWCVTVNNDHRLTVLVRSFMICTRDKTLLVSVNEKGDCDEKPWRKETTWKT